MGDMYDFIINQGPEAVKETLDQWRKRSEDSWEEAGYSDFDFGKFSIEIEDGIDDTCYIHEKGRGEICMTHNLRDAQYIVKNLIKANGDHLSSCHRNVNE